MINQKLSRQNWTTGQTVKVGFLSLTVKAAIPTPGDHRPDAYILANQVGTQLYRFVPHHGLEKISPDDAKAMLEQAARIAAREVAGALANAQKAVAINKLFAET